MKTLSFYSKQITIGNRAYQILVPQFLLNHMYVGEFRKNDFMIFSNGHGLRMLASMLVLISRNVDKILYLPTRDNPLTEYLQRWFWDSSNNDLVLYHHSLQFNINEWKEIRQNLKGYKDKVTYNINEEEYTEVPQKEYDRFRYRENKDGLHIKRKYETLFFEGSAKVFSIMSGRLIPLSEEGHDYYLKYGSHDHAHMDLFLCRKDMQLCVDYYDAALWDSKNQRRARQ